MELSPELLLEAKFDAARRGYDMAEVDDFLERVAEAVEVLLDRLATEFDRAEQAEAELEALRTGERAPTSPGEKPGQTSDDDEAATESVRILVHAERTAEAAIADARAEADSIRQAAEQEAATARQEAMGALEAARTEAESEARRAGDAAKRAVQDEVQTLRRDRDVLAADAGALKGWLEGQRERLRATADDLRRMVDDPEALGAVEVPEVTETEPAGSSSEPDAAGSTDDVEADTATSNEPPAEVPDDVPEDAGTRGTGSTDDAGDGLEPTQAVPIVEDAGVFDQAEEQQR